MGYGFRIGEAVAELDYGDNEVISYVTAGNYGHPNAPMFRGGSTWRPTMNSTNFSYSGFAAFCDEAGLNTLFSPGWLMPEHPGAGLITIEAVQEIAFVRFKWMLDHPGSVPGYNAESDYEGNLATG